MIKLSLFFNLKELPPYRLLNLFGVGEADKSTVSRMKPEGPL